MAMAMAMAAVATKRRGVRRSYSGDGQLFVAGWKAQGGLYRHNFATVLAIVLATVASIVAMSSVSRYCARKRVRHEVARQRSSDIGCE
jgi:hypothetical protein